MYALRMLWRKSDWLVCAQCTACPMFHYGKPLKSWYIYIRNSSTEKWWPCKLTISFLRFLFSQNKTLNHNFYLLFSYSFLLLSDDLTPSSRMTPLFSNTSFYLLLSSIQTDLDDTNLRVSSLQEEMQGWILQALLFFQVPIHIQWLFQSAIIWEKSWSVQVRKGGFHS